LFGLAALAGWPLTAGFISKESIMPHVFSGVATFKDVFGFVILQMGIVGTAFYVTRIAYITCFKSDDKNVVSHKISNLLSLPVLVLSFGAGFWLFGYNPFSSAGWLSNILETQGHFLMPDFFALALGTFLGHRFSKSVDWTEIPVSKAFKGPFSELSLQISIIQSGWKYLLQFGQFMNKVDRKIIDRTLDGGSKVVVIGGHFTNFADRKLVDGIISGFILLIKFIGENLWEQSRKTPQSVAFFIIFVLFLIVFFFN
jgi:NADH:ubiquinone oxidoreductase subunit 5 (subunit L)/multisubunit Na+/H+ antiporter MnhA subunit